MPDVLPITVVIPAYNAAATLGAALASIAAGRCVPERTIVVDDGSTDATVRIARAFETRVISQRNGGLADARNAGIRAATTPWIALLDADDVWTPGRLAEQWALHERSPGESLVTSDYAYLVGDRITEPAVMPTFAQYRAMVRTPLDALGVRVARADMLAAILTGNFVLPSSMLVARRLFTDFDAFYTERERLPSGPEFFIGEDYEWLLRVLRHTDVLVVERPLVHYRRSASSLSADGGRLRYGDVVLGELVRASPHRYAVGADRAFERMWPYQLAHAAARYLAAGDVVRADAMLVRGGSSGDVRARVLGAVTAPFARTSIGRHAFAGAFRLWRTVVRPALASVRSRR